jgi:CSLREA domain-containing protein
VRHVFASSIVAAFLGIALFGASTTQAQTPPVIYTVDTTADLADDNVGDGLCHTSANTCSLRAAIRQANQLTGSGGTLIQVPRGTYVLSDGALYLGNASNPYRSLTIAGAGAAATIIDANHYDSAIFVDSSLITSISGITVRNGWSNYGGAISNSGTLTLTRCIIEDNHAEIEGGGIASRGDLNVIKSTIRWNSANGYGGGMMLDGRTRISDSTIDDNVADSGGGIVNYGKYDGSNHLYLINSTLSSNAAATDGGGIFSDFDHSITFLYNTSVVDNDADHDHDENGGIGGGIYSQAGAQIIVVNSLIARNTVAIYNEDDCHGALEAYGWNLLGEAADCVIGGNGQFSWGFVALNTFGALQDNGGPTLTHALLAGSQAIDSTSDNLGCVDEAAAPLTTDQRGAPRIAGARCDVGAFEFGAVVDPIFKSGFED